MQVYTGMAKPYPGCHPTAPIKTTKNISKGCAFTLFEKMVGWRIKLSMSCMPTNTPQYFDDLRHGLFVNGAAVPEDKVITTQTGLQWLGQCRITLRMAAKMQWAVHCRCQDPQWNRNQHGHYRHLNEDARKVTDEQLAGLIYSVLFWLRIHWVQVI